MRLVDYWCMCDHMRSKGKYANKEAPKREVNHIRGWQIIWEKEKKVHLNVNEELQKIQKFEDRPIEVKTLLADLESAKLFTHPWRLNREVPLGMKKEVDLPSGHKRFAELTNRYAKLIGVGIPTEMDTSIGKVDMMGSNHIMNGNGKLTRKVDLMKASESQGPFQTINVRLMISYLYISWTRWFEEKKTKIAKVAIQNVR